MALAQQQPIPMPILILLFAIFPFWLVGTFLLATNLLARASGWSRLARHFRAAGPPPPDAPHYRRRTVKGRAVELLNLLPLHRLFPVTYSNCIHVTLTPAGLHLKPMLPFRHRHPPLLIPWQHVGPPATRRILFSRSLTLPISAHDVSWTVHLPHSALAELTTYIEAATQHGIA